MKKWIVLILAILLLLSITGCATWHTNWALTHGYIKAEDCPDVPEVPERQALPHPKVPLFATTDNEGNPVVIDEAYLMSIIIQLFGTVEKFQYLVEIYEREYLNAGGTVMPDLTLEELKALYEERLGKLRDVTPEEEAPAEETPAEEETPTTEMTLGAVEKEMTVGEFKQIVDAWNEFQKENQ